MSHDVFTIGEAMLRLSPPPGVAIETATHMQAHVAGAEANVAVALASLGRSVAWCSRLPANRLGTRVARELRAAGVSIDDVVWDPDGRLGTYFVDLGSGPGGVSVIYDRAASAATFFGPDDVPWDSVDASRVIHLTGITPALSGPCREAVVALADRARDSDRMLSVDVNHRSKLWPAAEAAEVMTRVATGADLLTCTREDAAEVFGIDGTTAEVGLALSDHLGAHRVVVTDGAAGAVLVEGGSTTTVAARPTTIRDRLGAGDAFVAGVLDGFLDGDTAAGVERGVVLAAVALSTSGDQITVDRQMLERLSAEGTRGVDR